MFNAVLILVVIALIYDARSNSTEVDGSKNFYVSEGMSKNMYKKMRADGMSQDGLKKFVRMEDTFLSLEQKSVRSGIPHTVDATLLSNMIKQSFPMYDFSYHTLHLKQIAEPTKTVNRNILTHYS